jgi:hypothetical protein
VNIQYHSPEDNGMNLHCHENLKISYTSSLFSVYYIFTVQLQVHFYEIRGFHGSENLEGGILGYDAVVL